MLQVSTQGRKKGISYLAEYNQQKKCPKCGNKSLGVLESRKVTEGTRRRYRCVHCGHRETRYELSEAAYVELKELRRVIGGIRGFLGTQESPDQIPCAKCANCNGDSCAFEIPEFDTADSVGCNYFEATD